jgi:hypothetical protein
VPVKGAISSSETSTAPAPLTAAEQTRAFFVIPIARPECHSDRSTAIDRPRTSVVARAAAAAS